MLRILCLLLTATSFAQIYYPSNENVTVNAKARQAFTNANICIKPGTILQNATLLVEDGVILGVGNGLGIPKDFVVTDLKGKYIYPSFIDIFSAFGQQKPTPAYSSSPVYDVQNPGFYWNRHIKANRDATQTYSFDASKAEEYLKNGFGIVNSMATDGVARGTSALVALNSKQSEKRLLLANATTSYSFDRSVAEVQSYPTSMMGSIALLRQFFLDAAWYKTQKDVVDGDLRRFNETANLPKIFECSDVQTILRAAKLAKEFGFPIIAKGKGNEYERINELKASNTTLILPLQFPEAFDVSDVYIAELLDFNDLLYWNQAPANAAAIARAQIPFVFTTYDLKKADDFKSAIQKVIRYGLSADDALAALTTTPAKLLNQSNTIGSIEKGKTANFIISSAPLFDNAAIWYDNYVQGVRYILQDKSQEDLRGTYALTLADKKYTVKLTGNVAELQSEVTDEQGAKYNSKVSFIKDQFSLLLKPADSLATNFVRLAANVKDPNLINGQGRYADETVIDFQLKRTTNADPNIDVSATAAYAVLPVRYPNVAYGTTEMPKSESILYTHATVWTNEKEGILTDTDVLVKDGKIAAIGKNLQASARVIDLKGKHLTTGIIDEHSHIAISAGVNEAGHNCTAEVSIRDVVNANDVNIYRNLSGGVTTAQLLHGSANPIGGQSAIIQLKWGASGTDLLLSNQPKFIKFALGENVKQSNWGIQNPSRYPQSRMGVEQTFAYYFNKARAYQAEWTAFSTSKKKSASPRRDVELETLVEVLEGKRFITCHSYVQSEILMLMKLAEQYGFRVNTFTHILEGYKVADEMKAHGAAGSTFSDWWAYKFEVNDAIPYNGALMHKQGVLVGFNSDDAEMSRRLNQEAGKAVKYGKVSEEEAWKFVTLNPAKMLHIDERVGSIKVGKQADLVVWSDNPLSVYAKAEQTMIEGVIYFDRNQDEERLKNMQKEKAILISQMLEEKNRGMIVSRPKKSVPKAYHCDTLEP